MKNYHYTKAMHLPSIINEGVIRTTFITGVKRERPAAWLTRSEKWELCCSISKINPKNGGPQKLSMEEMRDLVGVCRIKIRETLPTTSWNKFKYVGKVSESVYDSFTEFSIQAGGKTHLWNCSFSPITEEYFESIEMLVGDTWVVWDKTVSIEDFVNVCHSNNSLEELPNLSNYHKGFLEQEAFLLINQEGIIDAWEKCKFMQGYFEMYVNEDYSSCKLRFIESDFIESDFKCLVKNSQSEKLYLHVFWMATRAQYKRAMPYDPTTKSLIICETTIAA